MFSRRSSFPASTEPFQAAVSALRQETQTWVDLTCSNPTQLFGYPDAKLRQALLPAGSLVYAPEPLGERGARLAITSHYRELGFHLRPEQLFLSASTSEAYSFLFKLLCDSGDEVLIPAPSYPLFEMLAQLDNVELSAYPLRYDGAWHIDYPALRSTISERTRAVILVNPNNPTGNYLHESDLLKLQALGLPLIFDEVFWDYGLGPGQPCSGLSCHSALAFVLGGLSKCLALPQLKLAWTSMLGPAPLLRAAQARIENIADTYLSVGTPIQLALPELLALRGELTLPLKARISQNYALLGARLAGTALTPLRVEGGFSAVIQLPNTQSESAWALSFLEQARVLVQPGFFYGFGQEPYIVLSLITPEADFALGLDRLVAQVEFSLVSPIHGP